VSHHLGSKRTKDYNITSNLRETCW